MMNSTNNNIFEYQNIQKNIFSINPIEDEISIESSATDNSIETSAYSIRAANHDNYFDRQAILSIFKNHYNEKCAFPETLQEDFWTMPEKINENKPISSLLLVHNESQEVIAHLGLAFHENDKYAEILLPAIKGQWKHIVKLAFSIFYQKLSELKERRGWTHFVAKCPSSDTFFQYVATTFFGCHAVSLVPQNKNNHSKRRDLVAGLLCPIKLSRYRSAMFIPLDIKEEVETLIKNLGFVLQKNPQKGKSEVRPLRINYTGNSYRKLGYLDIFPSAFNDNSISKNKISRLIKRLPEIPVIRLRTDSPNTLKIYELLISMGFRYSGVDLDSGDIVIILSNITHSELHQTVLFGKQSTLLKTTMSKTNH